MLPFRPYSSYTEDDMQRAISLVNNGTVISVAAKTYGIPRSSLTGRLYGRTRYGKLGHIRSVGAYYRCWMCPVKFNSASLLKSHVTAYPHYRMKVVCPFCLETVNEISQSVYLKRHVQRTHGEKVIARLPRDFFTERACYYLAVYPDDYKRFVKPIQSTSTAAKTAIDLILQWHETLTSPIKTMEVWLKQWETHNKLQGVHGAKTSFIALSEAESPSESTDPPDSQSVWIDLSNDDTCYDTCDNQAEADQSVVTASSKEIATDQTTLSTTPMLPRRPALSTSAPSSSSTSKSIRGLRDRNRTRFSCETCFRRFETEADLRMHRCVQATGNKRKLYKCSQCDKRFMYLSNLNAHQSACQRHRILENPTQSENQCSICYACFHSQTDLIEHRLSHNTGKGPKQPIEHKQFPCKKCHMGFRTERALMDHLTKHTIAAYSCPLCGKPITRYFNVRYHVHNTHKVSLEDLAKSGNEKAEQLIMVNRIGAKPIICHICWRGFERKDSFKRHIEKHKDPQNKDHSRSRNLYKCTLCEVEVDELLHLKNHVMCTHNEDGAESNRVGSLQKLICIPRSYNGNPCSILTLVPIRSVLDTSKTTEKNSTSGITKPSNIRSNINTESINNKTCRSTSLSQTVTNQYRCDICGHNFTNRDSLVRHINIHINNSDRRTSKYTPIRSRIGYAKVGLREEDINICALGETIKDDVNSTVMYKCKVCLSKLDTEDDLFRHIRGMADYHCKYFMKKVSDLFYASLEPKRKRIYWTCEVCGLYYTLQRSLYAHRRRSHGMLQSESSYSERILHAFKVAQVSSTSSQEQRFIERSLRDNLVSEADSTDSCIPCNIDDIVIDNPEEQANCQDTLASEEAVTQTPVTAHSDNSENHKSVDESTTAETHMLVECIDEVGDEIKLEDVDNNLDDSSDIKRLCQEYISETNKQFGNTMQHINNENNSKENRIQTENTDTNTPEKEKCVDSPVNEDTGESGAFGAVSVDRMCINCEESIAQGQPSLSCQLCCQTFCLSCSRLPSEVLSTLKKGPSSGLIWMCAVCRPNFPAYMGLLSQLAQFEDVLNKRFTHVSNRLTNVEDNAEVLCNIMKDSDLVLEKHT